MSFSVDDLKAQLPGGGARANLFRVTLPAGRGSDNTTHFLIKAASLPGSVIGQIDVPFRGRQLKVAGDRTFENWTVTVINDIDFAIRDAMEDWMNSLNDHVAATGEPNPNSYQDTLIVEQLDREGVTRKTITLSGAFPINMSAIDLSYETTDTIQEFTVEFAYQYWTGTNS